MTFFHKIHCKYTGIKGILTVYNHYEFIDFHKSDLLNPDIFNNKMPEYLIWHNTKRVHYAFKNKLSPIQFILPLQTNNFNLP